MTCVKLSCNHCLNTGRQLIQMDRCIVSLLYLHVVNLDVIVSQSSHRCSHPTLGSRDIFYLKKHSLFILILSECYRQFFCTIHRKRFASLMSKCSSSTVVLQHQRSKRLLHVAFSNDLPDTGPQLFHDGRPLLSPLFMLAACPKKIATGSFPCIYRKCPLPCDDVQLFHRTNALHKRFQRITIFTDDPQFP